MKAPNCKTTHAIGTAGWTIPKERAAAFPADGSHLQRYARVLTGVEINSSFYRPHQAKTYRRWSDEIAPTLQFAVKVAKVFTHEKKLDIERDEFAEWLEPVSQLGDKLGALLVQIPPKQAFDLELANRFFKNLRAEFDRTIAFEPRHLSWIANDALALLDFFNVTKVEADPERCPSPIDRTRTRYIRLHGTPQIYKSLYEPEIIAYWVNELRSTKKPSWVIFDNTTYGHATANALDLLNQVTSEASDSSSSRKLSRRKRGATTNIVPTVTKLMTAPKTAD